MSHIREIETLKNICSWHGIYMYCEIAIVIAGFSMLWGKDLFF